MLGFKSKNAVFKLIEKFIDEGIFQKDSSGRLLAPISIDEVPLLGLVEAGFPTMADTLDETISIDDYLIKNKDKTYLFEVKGESMIEEGIKEGDLVVVEKNNDAKDGDIVIAYVDGGWTLKFLRKSSGKTWLEPANKNFKPIYPKEELKIAAKVVGVIRKY